MVSHYGGIFDYDLKKERLEEVLRELEDPAIWNDQSRAQAMAKEKGELENVLNVLDGLATQLEDAQAMLDLAVEADDESLLADVQTELTSAEEELAKLEFRRMFSNPMDPNPCYVEIQAGSGGTEAQDWASMLLRMYMRWIERHGFKAELMEESDGDVAGIKSATIRVEGEYAYGWLRTESGVHRLVRKSPFDSGNRLIRHFLLCLSRQKSMTTLKLISTHLTCVPILTVLRVQVVSTLTKLTLRYV